MTDRQSRYPGRVRLTNVSTGQVTVYDMERADEPTQMGTGLVKANLLTDATAALLGLEQSDPTVNDALAALAGGVGGVSNYFCTCSSAGSSAQKLLNISSGGEWERQEGSIITVSFDETNTATRPYFVVGDYSNYITLSGFSYIEDNWTLPYAGISGSILTYIYHAGKFYCIGMDMKFLMLERYLNNLSPYSN